MKFQICRAHPDVMYAAQVSESIKVITSDEPLYAKRGDVLLVGMEGDVYLTDKESLINSIDDGSEYFEETAHKSATLDVERYNNGGDESVYLTRNGKAYDFDEMIKRFIKTKRKRRRKRRGNQHGESQG